MRSACRIPLLACALVLLGPPAARAAPASGPHETVQITATTKRPHASTGLAYAAQYHAAGSPRSTPPALRRLVIALPAGTRLDTSVPGRCTASDAEIMLLGETACPLSARVGTGQVTVQQFGLGVATYDTVLYNAPGQQLELVESGRRVLGIAHTYIHGTTLDGPVPTCATGGSPPSGCPFDELTLLANHLQTTTISAGRGRSRRDYGETPPTCPRSRRWRGDVRFYYADGSVDSVPFAVPCLRTPRGHRQARTRRPTV